VIGLVEPAVSNWDVLLRIGAALALGGLVGLEREFTHQRAGLRTHITVALGAALFGLLSVHGFDAYVQPRGDSNYQIDVTRVASQVVVGVGFLGAGAILKEGATVRGLTTAASLWATAAIGLAVGLGNFVAGTATTGALLVSLVGLRAPRGWVRRRAGRGTSVVTIELAAGAEGAATVRALLDLPNLDVRTLALRDADEGLVIEVALTAPPGTELAEALAGIVDRPEVRSLEIG
jgi:putative Mg2+ transporter-C (MgtC) family protein